MFNMFDMTDNIMTPMEMTILMSEEYADQIIRTFKQTWDGESNPDEFLTDLADKILPDTTCLLPEGVKRVRNEIRNYLEVNHYGIY